MPPTVALLIWLILLLALLCFDPAKVPGTSPALWVPVIWMFILGSRLTSQWLGGTTGTLVNVLEEGNPLDRTIDLFLIALAVCILLWRGFRWDRFFADNVMLVLFVLFALLSVFWSDFPFVAFKRWFRDIGNYLMVLVVLSDGSPQEALRALLRRLTYLLVPLSVVLIKYYPGISRQYDGWTGEVTFTGAATSKNMLGMLCLISGLFFFWDTVTRWSDRKAKGTKRVLFVNFVFMAMTAWLLSMARSATSQVCLIIGCVVIIILHTKMFGRHPRLFKILIPTCFMMYLVLAFGFDLSGNFASAVGRNPTLTDRTKIWTAALNMHTNLLVGAGYESFWMGSRLQRFWQMSGLYGINEAHDGYLEVFLNLGLVGVVIISGFVIATYRKICKNIATESSVGSLAFAFWTITLFYNVTEAGFRSGLMWITLLLVGLEISQKTANEVSDLLPYRDANDLMMPPFKTVDRRA